MAVVRSLRLGCVALLLAMLAACGSTPPVPDGHYRVVRGDTLAKIARDHGQTVNALMRMNSLSNPNRIEVGQVLRVSGAGAVASAPSSSRTGRATPPARAPSAAVSRPSGPVPARRITLAWPADGKVTRGYDGSNSRGIVIANRVGAPVKAAASGTVVYADSGLRGYGNMVIVQHDTDYLSVYAHNRRLSVKQNQRVSSGQQVAEMGEVSPSSPGVYFEVRYKGQAVDPRRLLPAR